MQRKLFLVLSVFLLPTVRALPFQESFSVAGISPPSQAVVDAQTLEIVIAFSAELDTASVNHRSLSVFGRWTGVCPGDISFENDNRQVRFKPQKLFSAGEWVTISLSKQIQSTTGDRLINGYSWNFWTRSGPGSLDLQKRQTIGVRQPGESRVRTYGAYAGDLNGDGFHDFTVPNEDASDIRIFLNDGTGNYGGFEIVPLPPNSRPSTNEGADFNGDGFLDFAVGNIDGNSVSVFFGDGGGHLDLQDTYDLSAGTRGLTILDLNADGAPDIVTAHRAGSTLVTLLNDGTGRFSIGQIIPTGFEGETSAASADFNEDGILDVAVGTFDSRTMLIFTGDGQGQLTLASNTRAGGVAWMVAVGDLNNDGHVDVVSANSFVNQFAVLFGDGTGRLAPPEAYNTGNFPLAIDVGDLDGDGDLDVVTSNFQSASWTIYENDGKGTFVNPRTLHTSRAGSCAVLHDRDRDGDLDMTGIDELDDLLQVFDNPGPATSVHTPNPIVAQDFELLQSYPNPFSKGNMQATGRLTAIRVPFFLQRPAEVTIELFNLRGQRIAVLTRGAFQAGRYAVFWNPQDLAPGLYFYRLFSSDVVLTRKILLLP